MKVKLLKIMAGPEGVFHPGQILDIENGEELVAAGCAISLEEKEEKPKKKTKK